MQETGYDFNAYVGRTVIGSDGDKIGSVDDVYLDESTGQPGWVSVTTGWFGLRRSYVPLSEAEWQGEDLVVPYTKQQLKDAPNYEPEGALSADDERSLYGHYQLDYDWDDRTRADAGTTSSDDAMTVSEEELRVATHEREAGRARLRKYVDVERAETNVAVAHDEVHIEREPIHAGNVDDAYSGPEISESEYEVVLTEEVVEADVETVPKERVRLETDRVVEEETVGADLRKEARRAREGGHDSAQPRQAVNVGTSSARARATDDGFAVNVIHLAHAEARARFGGFDAPAIFAGAVAAIGTAVLFGAAGAQVAYAPPTTEAAR